MIKTYSYKGKQLTSKQVHQLKKEVGIDWIRRRLAKGLTVEAILNEPVLTPSQVGRRGRKLSHWG